MYHVEKSAGIAQLGERQTEDLKVACSIHAHRITAVLCFFLFFLLFSWSAPLKLGWRKKKKSGGGDDADARDKFRFRVWWRGN